MAARVSFAFFIIDCLEECGALERVERVEEEAVVAVSCDLLVPCFEWSSTGMVI